MPKFIDADGREWHVAITIAEVKRVRAELEVDLLDIGSEDLFSRLVQDPVLIVDVLHVVLQEECARRQIDATGFARGLRGDAIDSASQALLEALVDFFPSRRRAVLRAAVTKTDRWMTTTADHALTVIESDRMDQLLAGRLQALDQEIEDQIVRLSGRPSPSGAPSPESTPAF